MVLRPGRPALAWALTLTWALTWAWVLADRTVRPAPGHVAGRSHPDRETPAAAGTVAGRVVGPAAALALIVGAAAAGAVGVRQRWSRHNAAVRAPTGMRRSSSICRSSAGDRPSVVR